MKILAFGALLSACAGSGSNDPYRLSMAFHSSFKILWITDIHYGDHENSPDYSQEDAHLQGMIEQAKANEKPDLLVLTGDQFRTATALEVSHLLQLIDSYGIPWALTYGNHDTESFSTYRYYINDQIAKCKNQLFVDVKNDSLTGLTNYYIDLTQNKKTVCRLYLIDSNTYQNPDQEGSGYDVIHEEQLNHLKDIYQKDGAVPGYAFFHIPLCEFEAAYTGYKNGEYEGQGENGEPVCPPYKNNNAYEVLKSINVKACFCGHDHKNYSDINYKNEMVLSYGLKATDLDYHTENLYGYKIITLEDDPTNFKIQDIKNVRYLY